MYVIFRTRKVHAESCGVFETGALKYFFPAYSIIPLILRAMTAVTPRL